MRRYILLLRHGATEFEPDKDDKERPLKYGGKDIKSVASALAEYLTLLPSDKRIVIGEIWHGAYRQVRESGGIIYDRLLKSELVKETLHQQPEVDLNPDNFWKDRSIAGRQRMGKMLLHHVQSLPTAQNRSSEDATRPNAILVVGHAPQLGWIAETILNRPHPIHRAELVCIAIEDSPPRYPWQHNAWVMWVISPSDDTAMASIQNKIKSKMDLAGILGGLITGVLGLSLLDANKFSDLLNKLTPFHTFLFYASALFLLLALSLYFATLYAYDRLLMPTRFWAEKAEERERHWLVQRPPSSSLWVLYQNMIRIWNRLFMPATYSVILGLICLSIVVFRLKSLSLIVICILAAPVVYYIWHHKPVLGVED